MPLLHPLDDVGGVGDARLVAVQRPAEGGRWNRVHAAPQQHPEAQTGFSRSNDRHVLWPDCGGDRVVRVPLLLLLYCIYLFTCDHTQHASRHVSSLFNTWAISSIHRMHLEIIKYIINYTSPRHCLIILVLIITTSPLHHVC